MVEDLTPAQARRALRDLADVYSADVLYGIATNQRDPSQIAPDDDRERWLGVIDTIDEDEIKRKLYGVDGPSRGIEETPEGTKRITDVATGEDDTTRRGGPSSGFGSRPAGTQSGLNRFAADREAASEAVREKGIGGVNMDDTDVREARAETPGGGVNGPRRDAGGLDASVPDVSNPPDGWVYTDSASSFNLYERWESEAEFQGSAAVIVTIKEQNSNYTVTTAGLSPDALRKGRVVYNPILQRLPDDVMRSMGLPVESPSQAVLRAFKSMRNLDAAQYRDQILGTPVDVLRLPDGREVEAGDVIEIEYTRSSDNKTDTVGGRVTTLQFPGGSGIVTTRGYQLDLDERELLLDGRKTGTAGLDSISIVEKGDGEEPGAERDPNQGDPLSMFKDIDSFETVPLSSFPAPGEFSVRYVDSTSVRWVRNTDTLRNRQGISRGGDVETVPIPGRQYINIYKPRGGGATTVDKGMRVYQNGSWSMYGSSERLQTNDNPPLSHRALVGIARDEMQLLDNGDYPILPAGFDYEPPERTFDDFSEDDGR